MLSYSEGSQLCGLFVTNENELIIPIEISIPHSTELLNINILSTVNESPFNVNICNMKGIMGYKKFLNKDSNLPKFMHNLRLRNSLNLLYNINSTNYN